VSSESPSVPERLRSEAAHVARSLTTFGPSRGRRWPLALQAGLAMAVPVVALAAFGRSDIALLSATGAFTVIYGGWLRPRERARFAPLMALALFACAALGTAAAAGGTLVVLAGVLVLTIAAACIAGWISLGPPGPVFFVLVFGLSAQVTAVRGGARVVDPWLYLAVVAASSAFACLVVVAPLLLPRYRREPVRRLRDLFPRRWGAAARALLLRAAIVAVVGSEPRSSSTRSARTGSSVPALPSSGCRWVAATPRCAASIAPSAPWSAPPSTSPSRSCRCRCGRWGCCSAHCRSRSNSSWCATTRWRSSSSRRSCC
jgi:hypothetical protein